MSWVVEFLSTLNANITGPEAAILLGLVLVAVLGLVLPLAAMRRQRSYRSRDAEFRRLQNM